MIDPLDVPDPGMAQGLGDLLARDPAPGPGSSSSGLREDRSSAAGLRESAFQDRSRASHSEQPVPPGGVPRALREAAELSGLDPLAELYNEALRYAQEGHLRLARERLQMLLCMAPDDGDARLMLARVFVAGQRWSDALGALDEASSCGVDVPMSLRRAVEDHLRSERLMSEEQQKALRVREEGEVKALRQEARRLRSENAQLSGQIGVLEREVRKWAWATASVSALACVFIAGSLVLGRGADGSDVAEADAPAVEAAGSAPSEGIATAALSAGADPGQVAPAPEGPVEARAPEGPPPDLGALVQAALAQAPGLADTAVMAAVRGDQVVLTGEVVSYKQRRTAERAVGAVPGVASVDASAVALRVKTHGAVHVVEKGDTLSHVAFAYYGDSTRTEDIEKANHLKGQVLRIGQTLVVPPL